MNLATGEIFKSLEQGSSVIVIESETLKGTALGAVREHGFIP